MPKLRVGVLYDATDSGVEEPAEAPKTSRRKRRAKHDHEEIYEALKKTGHEPFYHTLDGTPETLHSLATERADLYFNLTESYAADDTKEMHVAAYLELMGRRYTGAGPHGLYLAQDKALAKKIFAFHGIKTPSFMTGHRGRLEWAHDIHFPVIVKPGLEDGSIGIRFSAVVGSLKELMERIDAIHADFDGPVLIEEYIEGREIYVAVLGNGDPEALPIVELDLSQLPEGTPKIAGTEVKWEEGTEVYRRTQPFFPDDLGEEVEAHLKATAIAAYQALRLRDYGRIDIRLDAEGVAHVIECNPNPWLLSTAELAKAAKKSGRSHCDLIAEIVQFAIARYGA